MEIRGYPKLMLQKAEMAGLLRCGGATQDREGRRVSEGVECGEPCPCTPSQLCYDSARSEPWVEV